MSRLKVAVRWLLDLFSPELVESIVRRRSAQALARKEKAEWEQRILDVMACPENQLLSHVPRAGEIHDGFQLMFNGLKVAVSGYYGNGMTELLRRNRGSHEPQEEIVFAAVLSRLSARARMIECGAYWGFYSMWFARDVPLAKVWLIEPEAANLAVGQRNFAANRLSGDFTHAGIARESQAGPPANVCIDDFLATRQIEHLEILHADIQGAEVEMIQGADRTLSRQAVDYIFISTHGADLHDDCVTRLRAYDYICEVSVSPAESFSFDGLIVARRGNLPAAPLPRVSTKTRQPSP